MIIENIDGVMILCSEGTNKLTDYERTFFSERVYLGIGGDTDKYLEVPIEEWWRHENEDNNTKVINKLDEDVFNIKQSVDDTISDVIKTNAEIRNVSDSVYVLEDVVIDTDFRLMVVEMQLEYGGETTPLSLFSLNQRREVMDVYSLLRKKIERKNYDSKEEMQTMLDLYFFNTRITADQYDELTQLLSEQ